MASQTLPSGYVLQDYSIESVLGTGGFGITYLARDNNLGTQVAIKEYCPQDLASRDSRMTITPLPGEAAEHYEWGRQQFLKEARALAQFKDNNIVRVLRFLELNGTAYMIMEYEAGEGLLAHIRKIGQPSERLLLQVFVPILNGVHAMHSAGLLHLDIKPDNIYLRAGGTPMLIDFGSARNAARVVDSSERVALTPAYAAIEQYPNQGKLGPWTDIYSIGASLYRCISGIDPVDAMTRQQTMRAGKPDPLIPATKLEQGGYSVYLRECIDWAMQVDPVRRPKTAAALQEALMGKGVPGRQPTAAAKPQAPVPPAQKAGTQPGAGAGAATRSQIVAPHSAAGGPGGARKAGLSVQEFRTVEPAVDESRSPRRLKAVLAGTVLVAVLGLGATFLVYRGQVNHSTPMPDVSTPDAASVSPPGSEKDDSAGIAPGSVPRTEPIPAFPRFASFATIRVLKGHQDSVESLAFLDNGARLASGSVDGTIRIWEVESGKTVRTLRGHRRSVNAIVLSPSGNLLVSAGNESQLLTWDPATGAPQGKLAGHSQDVYALAFSPDGRWLASGGRDRTVIVWDMTTRKPVHKLEGHEDAIMALVFSPDGSWLLSGGKGGQLRRWNRSDGTESASLSIHQGHTVTAVGISPDGRWYATAGGDNAVRVWSSETNHQQRSLSQPPGLVTGLVFTPDGKQLLASGTDRTLRAWDVKSGGVNNEFVGHTDEVMALALSPDRRTVASAGKDKTIRLWRPESK